MYGKMVKSRAVCMIAALALMMSVFFILTCTKAQAGQAVVYTSLTRPSHLEEAGDGTKENPYNRFEDAMKNVQNGGTIYILGTGNAFLNVMDQQHAPFLIDKSITIEPEPGADKATLYSRASGIILGADVTMNNITLEFANGYHDQIFVNGHSLTLNNVTRLSNFRLIDIVAGGLYNKDGSSIGLPAGSDAQITIDGQNKDAVQFGNIYAGSMNGSYDGNTSITLKNIKSGSVGEIYGCGAKEAKFDTDNWFDTTEPPAPDADAAAYPVSGKVNIALDQVSMTKVDGAGAAGGAAVSLKHKYRISNILLANLSEVHVEEATTLEPTSLTAWPQGMDVSLAAGATLDISELKESVLKVGNFASQEGNLVLEPHGTLEVSSELTGNTALKFPDQSSRSRQQHAYVKAKPGSSGIFTYDAGYQEVGYLMEKQTNGEWHIVKGNNVTVSYDVNFDEDAEERGWIEPWFESIDKTQESLTGSEVVEVAEGYHFVHWIEKETGTVVGTEEQFVPSELKDGQYIAVFEGNQYKVRFHANGGSGTMGDQDFVYHVPQKLSKNAYENTGMVFNGWNTEANGTGTAYTDGQSVSRLTTGADQIIDLYAQWKVPPVQYSIRYELNGGTNHSSNPAIYTEDDTITLQAPTRKGYTFGGWYTDSSFTAETKVTQIEKGSNGNKTLYAKWTATPYKITYYTNNGTLASGSKTGYNITTATFSLKNPTRKGYTFGGWYTNSRFTTTSRVTSIAQGSTGNKTLYAKWTVTPYKITYYRNNGTLASGSKTGYNITTATFSLKNPTRKGYTFGGWYTSSKYTTKVTRIVKGSTGNKVFYAKWNKVTVAKAKTPVLTNLKGRSLKVSYSATTGAKGYQIQYSTSKKFTKAVTKTTTSRLYTAKKLQKGKTYHVRVRAYKTDSKGYKVYGSWSIVKSKKITK